MESPGEYLKRERELRGVSLEDIAETVKLSVRVLNALEDDRYDELPHPAYVKGFIRCYARYLGLDENDAVLRYEAYLREKEGEKKRLKLKEKEKKPPVIPAEERMPFLKPNKRLAAYFIAAGVAIIALYLFLGGGPPADDKGVEDAAGRRVAASEEAKPGSEEKVKPEGAGPAESRREEAKVPESEVKVPDKKAEAEAEKEGAPAGDVPSMRPVADKKPVDEEKRLVLDVLAKDTTWIKAEIDGTKQVEVLLRKGEHVRWEAAEVFF